MRRAVLPSRPPAAVGELAGLVEPAAVGAALARAGARPAEAPPLRLEKAWPLPRVPLMLLYREPGAGHPPVWWSIHALPADRPPGAYRRALKSGGAVAIEELGALAQRFPRDLLLDELPALVERPEAALRGVVAGAAEPAPDRIRSEVVGYKPARRCSLRFRFAGAEGEERQLFGKLLSPPVAREQWRVHAAAERAFALGGRDGVEIAGPERLLDETGLLLWRRREGISVHRMLAGGRGLAAVAAAGRGLAGLHASSPAWADSHGPERELATLGLWVGATAAAFPDQGVALLAAEHGVRRLARTAAAGPLLPAHRDFYDKQVMVEEGRTVLLDFETACRAEPELDLANFLAHLELRGLQGSASEPAELAASFLKSYEETAGRADRRRLAWYRASALLRLACVYAFRPRWGALSEALLEAARRAAEPITGRIEGVGR